MELALTLGLPRFTDGLDRVETQSFADRDELENEIYNALPVEAVGEPGQSEGEG